MLRLNLPFVPGDANLSAQTARRLLELQAWVAEQSAAGFAPQLGNADPVQETLTAGAAPAGTRPTMRVAQFTPLH